MSNPALKQGEDGPKKKRKKPDLPIVAVKTTADYQRMKLERLMSNPDKKINLPIRPKDKNLPPPPEFVRNIMGSSAGAGSGEFHVYRHLRRKEYARQKYIQDKAKLEEKHSEFQQKLNENQKRAEAKRAKKRAKRIKKKMNQMKKKKQNTSDAKKSGSSSESSSSESDDEDGDAGGQNLLNKESGPTVADNPSGNKYNLATDDDVNTKSTEEMVEDSKETTS